MFPWIRWRTHLLLWMGCHNLFYCILGNFFSFFFNHWLKFSKTDGFVTLLVSQYHFYSLSVDTKNLVQWKCQSMHISGQEASLENQIRKKADFWLGNKWLMAVSMYFVNEHPRHHSSCRQGQILKCDLAEVMRDSPEDSQRLKGALRDALHCLHIDYYHLLSVHWANKCKQTNFYSRKERQFCLVLYFYI